MRDPAATDIQHPQQPVAFVIGPALTWSELANIYDSTHTGRKARTLPLDNVFAWAQQQTELFHASESGTIHQKRMP